MQLTDFFRQIGQVNQNGLASNLQPQSVINSDSTSLTGVLSQLKAGEIFEGTIIGMNQDKVVINLANGENFSARIDSGVRLTAGGATFFQVKSNENGQIALKAVSQDVISNPTLIKALSSAGVEVSERTLEMVKLMMERQMPIDTKSIRVMVRAANEFPDTSVKSLVSLQQLKLPINELTIEQLEHHENGQAKVDKGLEAVIEKLPDCLDGLKMTKEGMQTLKDLLDCLLPEQSDEPVQKVENHTSQPLNANLEQAGETVLTKPTGEGILKASEGALQETEVINKSNETRTKGEEISLLLNHANDERNAEGNKQIATSILKTIREIIDNDNELNIDLKKHLSGKEFKALLRDSMEEQWFIRPEEMQKKEEVDKLFRRIGKQLEMIEKTMVNDVKTEQLGKAITEVRNNISFMNQLNQLYNYVQIPLKMINQNTNGDLYVYTNKKAIRKVSQEISAHLHLEMEHLGTTDVYVKLQRQKLSTEFVLEDEKSLELVMEHIDILTSRLQKKGYEVYISAKEKEQDGVENENFVANILGEERTATVVSRYSFDVKV